MNSFMNAVYNAVGSAVTGYYYDTAFEGVITNTRVKYGNDISVTVEDGENIWIIDASELYAGAGGAYTNLHVYFN